MNFISVETLLKIADKLGVPVLFSVILCAGIYYTASWAATHIFEPVVDRHVQFLDATQKNLGVLTENESRQTFLLEQIRDDQRKFPAVAENAK